MKSRYRMDVSRVFGAGYEGEVVASTMAEAVDVASRFVEGITAAGWRAAPDGADGVVLRPLLEDEVLSASIDLSYGLLDGVFLEDGAVPENLARLLAARTERLTSDERAMLEERLDTFLHANPWVVGPDGERRFEGMTLQDAVMALNVVLVLGKGSAPVHAANLDWTFVASVAEDGKAVVAKRLDGLPKVRAFWKREGGKVRLVASVEPGMAEAA